MQKLFITTVQSVRDRAGNVYTAFRASYGDKSIEATISGDDSNVRATLRAMFGDWDKVREHVQESYKTMPVRPFNNWSNALPYAGCCPSEIGAFLVDNLNIELFDLLTMAGVQIDHHATDLYCPVNPTTRDILAMYPKLAKPTTFTSNVDCNLWYDVPFQYLPAWPKRR